MNFQSITAESITSLFPIQPEHVPKICTPTEKPNFTSLQRFQRALDTNAMAIPSDSNELGHLALIVSTADFRDLNGSSYVKPV